MISSLYVLLHSHVKRAALRGWNWVVRQVKKSVGPQELTGAAKKGISPHNVAQIIDGTSAWTLRQTAQAPVIITPRLVGARPHVSSAGTGWQTAIAISRRADIIAGVK